MGKASMPFHPRGNPVLRFSACSVSEQKEGLRKREPGPKCEQIAAGCFLCGLIIFDLLFVSGFIIIKGKERCMKRNGTPCIKRFRCGFGTDAPAEGS